jgi:hypothetical protein
MPDASKQDMGVISHLVASGKLVSHNYRIYSLSCLAAIYIALLSFLLSKEAEEEEETQEGETQEV